MGAFGLQPHLETFKLSTNPEFVAKVRMSSASTWPRPSAQLYCASSQIQALDRSQPMLPMRPGQAARRSASELTLRCRRFAVMADADELFRDVENCRQLAGEADGLTRRILLEVAEQHEAAAGLALAYPSPRERAERAAPAPVFP
jgi:hypothetical protein